MKGYKSVSSATIERLPLYYRCLNYIYRKDKEMISSKELGKKLGIQPTQVRKDLSYYGEFGRRGVGYNISNLKKVLKKILGANQKWPAVLVGAGNLGRALINFKGAGDMGLEIVGVFDNDLNKIGNAVGTITVKSTNKLVKFTKQNQIKIGIITVPADAAQEIANLLIDSGISGIWNFAPATLEVPENVNLRNEDLAIGVGSLIYNINWEEDNEFKIKEV